MTQVKLKWLVSASNAGEVIDKSHWGEGEESLYTCARGILRSDFNNFPTWKRTTSDDLLLTRNGTPYIHIPVEGAIYSNVVQRISVPKVDKFYLRYALEDRVRSFRGYGVSIESLNYEMWSNLEVEIPDLATQRQIADFLDRETARIDLLIEKKQRLVDAIKAKVSDFADLAVTQGLDQKSSMKPAQIPWIETIPSHWEIVRGKYLVRQMSRPPRDGDEVITAFRDGQVCLRSKRRTEGYTFAELEVGYQHIKRGDLVIHTMDAFAGAIGVSEDNGKSTGEYAVCTSIGDHNATYLAYLLRCMAKRKYISVLCPSVRERAPRFRFVRFAPVFLPVPPRNEQDAIVDAIERIRSGLSAAQTKTAASIDRLKEYRSALITAAVTGQIDVTTYSKSGTPDRQLDAIQEEMGA